MSRFLPFFVVFIALSVLPVSAQNPQTIERPDEPITTGCILGERHVPEPGVTYTPGVDLNGEPIIPADLPGTHTTIEIPKTFDFDLRVPVDERFAPETDMIVGQVTIDPQTNRLSWNDHPVAPLEGVDFFPLCPTP